MHRNFSFETPSDCILRRQNNKLRKTCPRNSLVSSSHLSFIALSGGSSSDFRCKYRLQPDTQRGEVTCTSSLSSYAVMQEFKPRCALEARSVQTHTRLTCCLSSLLCERVWASYRVWEMLERGNKKRKFASPQWS